MRDVKAVDKGVRGYLGVKATNKGLAVTFALSQTGERVASRVAVGKKGIRVGGGEITGNTSAESTKRTVPKILLVLTDAAHWSSSRG